MANKDREQSAVDAIYEILNEIKDLKKRLDIIDNNIKLLNNKVNKSSAAASKPGRPSATAPIGVSQPAKAEVVSKNIKVFGRIKNQRKKPIKDVKVKIFSPKGALVKSRSTDSEGYWEARIPPGQYGVEYDASSINKKFRPINLNINIDKDVKEYEVK
jgi:hypothetical protein